MEAELSGKTYSEKTSEVKKKTEPKKTVLQENTNSDDEDTRDDGSVVPPAEILMSGKKRKLYKQMVARINKKQGQNETLQSKRKTVEKQKFQAEKKGKK